METGSVAELISAVASVLALVAASFAAWAALKANHQQQAELGILKEERGNRERENERSAASKVAIWVRTDRGEKAALRYINPSDLPIYALQVRVVIPGEKFDVDYAVIGPCEQTRTLNGGSRRLLEQVDARCGPVDWKNLLEHGEIAASSSFRDLANKWWYRDFDGVLTGHENETSAHAAAETATGRWLARYPGVSHQGNQAGNQPRAAGPVTRG